MNSAEIAAATVTDEKLTVIEQSEEAITGLVAISKLHHLLNQISTDSARLIVRGNTGLNGFETGRLLARRFALPGTAQNISLSTKVLEFGTGCYTVKQDLRPTAATPAFECAHWLRMKM